jgi:hypothetical protein
MIHAAATAVRSLSQKEREPSVLASRIRSNLKSCQRPGLVSLITLD